MNQQFKSKPSCQRENVPRGCFGWSALPCQDCAIVSHCVKQQHRDQYQNLTTLPKACRTLLHLHTAHAKLPMSLCSHSLCWKTYQSTGSVSEKSPFLSPFSLVEFCMPASRSVRLMGRGSKRWMKKTCVREIESGGTFRYPWNSSLKWSYCGVGDISVSFLQLRVNRFTAHCCSAQRACRVWSWQPLKLFSVAWHKQSKHRFVSEINLTAVFTSTVRAKGGDWRIQTLWHSHF